MSKLKYLPLLLCLAINPAFAEQPSDQSVKELLTVTNAKKSVDDITGQMEAMMKKSMQASLQGANLTPEQKKVVDNLESKTVKFVKEQMTWDKLEPMYLQIYRESFSQEEIEGIVTFYKSPAGQAVVNKMPQVMQKTMGEMQKRMMSLEGDLRKFQEEAAAELQKLQPAQPAKSKGKK